ncbi:winged helix-turn-helix domain-containing protein [Streptomyces coacervatus]|uniref:Winged helix-turn-helix domain-containing protein n=1 Tax=Streptomyces coacervatus TaxID=647381 RepID=A0ABP7I567_9ACTN|nr:winged helix-turn-helix domain-containing protein [Streptomyces coacervatus]MDF2266117.1 winged helix-turn-helix domain-containing protein [Streptomyces coacervatus]
MLRIHCTARDLETIRIAHGPDPLWEIVCSLCRLQDRDGRIAFGAWRREATGRIRRGGEARDAVRALCELVPRSRYFPDFLTPPPVPQTGGVHAGIDRVLSTPRGRLRTEIGLLTIHAGAPAAADELARGEVAALERLGSELLTYHEVFVGPVWQRIETAVAADVAWRSGVLATGGVRALLETFRPMISWQAPVMEVDYPVDRDLRLEGRGLLLVPSYFCWRRPVSLLDEALLPVLVYPVDKTVVPDTPTAPDQLARLLGPTRAALLYETATRGFASTSALAGTVVVSVPSASQQLGVLREAGLVTSRRDGKYVLHSVTPLGLRLLGNRAGAAAEEPS